MAERTDGQPRVVRNAQATTRVLDYLRKNPNIILPYQEIMRELDLPAYTVGNSIGYLIKRDNLEIYRPMKGTVIYQSAKTTDAQKAEIAKALETTGVHEWKSAEMDVVSKYPTPELLADMEERINQAAYRAENARLDEVRMNSTYGTAVPLFDYVGKMEAYTVLRDSADELYVAVPLKAFLHIDD